MVGETILRIGHVPAQRSGSWDRFFVVTDNGTYEIGLNKVFPSLLPVGSEECMPKEFASKKVFEIRTDDESLAILLEDGSIIQLALDYDFNTERSNVSLDFQTRETSQAWREEFNEMCLVKVVRPEPNDSEMPGEADQPPV